MYTADPNVVPGAVKLASVTFDDMLAFSRAGAGVLAASSVERARDRGVVVQVRSSFSFEKGTLVGAEADSKDLVGVAHSPGVVTLVGSGAPSMTERVRAILEGRGIGYSDTPGEGILTILVSGEQTEDAVRCLHDGLLKLETTS